MRSYPTKQMFAIRHARGRKGLSELLRETYVDSVRDQLNQEVFLLTKDLGEAYARQVFGYIRYPKFYPWRCDEGMLARPHYWSDITRVPTTLCWQCGGTQVYAEEGHLELNCEVCNEWGYVEGYSYRKCLRCNKRQSSR